MPSILLVKNTEHGAMIVHESHISMAWVSMACVSGLMHPIYGSSDYARFHPNGFTAIVSEVLPDLQCGVAKLRSIHGDYQIEGDTDDDYQDFVKTVSSLLEACEKHPDAEYRPY